MDANDILIWLVGPTTAILAVVLFRWRQWGFAIEACALLALMGLLLAFSPGDAGWVCGILWLLLYGLPVILFRRLSGMIHRERYQQALGLAALLRWLHPMDGWRELPTVLRALDAVQHGRTDEAAALADRLTSKNNKFGRQVRSVLFRARGQWREFVAWVEDDLTLGVFRRDLGLVPHYVRALGELGDPNRMIQAFVRLEPLLRPRAAIQVRRTSTLFALAFAGRTPAVEAMLQGPLSGLAEPSKRFWRATALQASGNRKTAQVLLEELQSLPEAPAALASAASSRLANPLPAAEGSLTPEAKSMLSVLERDWQQEQRYQAIGFKGLRSARATLGISLALVLVYLAEEFLGGATNPGTLHRMGALLLSEALRGEWWRIAASVFLHFGPWHLLMNVAGLLLLGPFFERAFGPARTLYLFLTTGVGSMALVVLLYALGWIPDCFIIGASGGILGFVGASGVLLVRGWLKEHARAARYQFAMVLLMVGLQVAFDLANPESAFSAHLGGLVLGALLCLPMRPRKSAPTAG